MMAVAIMKFQGDSSLFRNCARATATVMLCGVDSSRKLYRYSFHASNNA